MNHRFDRYIGSVGLVLFGALGLQPNAENGCGTPNPGGDGGAVPLCDAEIAPGVSSPMTAPCVWSALERCLPEIASCTTENRLVSGFMASITCAPAHSWSSSTVPSFHGLTTTITSGGSVCFRSDRLTDPAASLYRTVYYDNTGAIIARETQGFSSTTKIVECLDQPGVSHEVAAECTLPTHACGTVTAGTCP